jgi:hypothetical protein
MTLEEMQKALNPYGIGMTGELGFNNTYALAMRREVAEKLGIRKISDLKNHPELRVGVTHEFLQRQDGWEPLRIRYGLQMKNVRGIDHALGYIALMNNETDVKDAYSTDAKIAENNLVVLEDDLNFFPQYKAVFLYRLGADPRAIAAIRKLEGTINETRMTRLNAEAERTNDYTLAASLYFGEKVRIEPLYSKLARWTARHLHAYRHPDWHPPRHTSQPAGAFQPVSSWSDRRHSDHPLAGVAGAARPHPILWHQPHDRYRRPLSLQPFADCSEHRCWASRHFGTVARVRRRIGA